VSDSLRYLRELMTLSIFSNFATLLSGNEVS